MLSGHDIICFSPNPWDALWRNRQQIMARLARQNRILFVEPTPYLRSTLASLPRPSPDHRSSINQSTDQPLPNLWLHRPPLYAPQSGRPPLSDLTFRLRRRSLRQAMRRLGMERPILWIFQYNLGEMLGQLGERLAIYHAVDEYSAYQMPADTIAGRDRRQIVRDMEADLIRRVDLVFVTSPALYETKRHLHSHVVLVPNGVDYDHFSSADLPPPPDLPAHRPRIGYAGVLNEKLDFPLLATVAARHPQWQFILIGPDAIAPTGPIRQQFLALQQLPNVHLLGRKPVAQLPAYLHACDVCLMPYAQSEWTRNISPLKLYEYLATGVPIVSTSIAAAQEFASSLWLADDPDAFAQAITGALATDSPDRRRRQQALAQAHTWDNRIAALSAAIGDRLIG